MSHPTVDIVVLVHNQLDVTKGFVQHLFSHTQNFNLIFVDNGSAPPTADYLKSGEVENKWKVIRSETNLGIIKGRNLGAQHISSDYFLNIDNDQYVKSGWLDILYNKMEEGYDIVGCEAWKLVPPGRRSGTVVVGNAGIIQDRKYFPHKRCTSPEEKFTYIGCGGMLIKKEVYDDIGLFDERYGAAFFEDPDLNWRANQAGYKLAWCPQCPIEHLAHRTINAQTSFSKNEQFLDSWNKFRQKWGDYFPEYAKEK